MSVFNNKIGKTYVLGSTLFSLLAIALIILVMLANSWTAISSQGWKLFTFHWNPASNSFGILPMLYGSISVTFIALIIAIPIGLATAIFCSEILKPKHRLIAKSLLEILAGIPSIIYGLIGVACFAVWIQDWFDLQSGRTIFSAGLILSFMILPTIITLCDDALQSVPTKYREAGLGLGLYQFELVKSILLPMAKQPIISAILLALGRAMGETMAVMLLIGSIDKIPSPFLNWLSPGQTISSKLGREIAEASFGSVHFSAMIFMGLILTLLVIGFSLLAQRKSNRIIRIYD